MSHVGCKALPKDGSVVNALRGIQMAECRDCGRAIRRSIWAATATWRHTVDTSRSTNVAGHSTAGNR